MDLLGEVLGHGNVETDELVLTLLGGVNELHGGEVGRDGNGQGVAAFGRAAGEAQDGQAQGQNESDDLFHGVFSF